MNEKDIQSLENPAVHRWYRFVLGYPDHLVRGILLDRVDVDGLILDPFLGTGTTVVEAKKMGIPSIGIDANPFSVFASRVKTQWNVDVSELEDDFKIVARGYLTDEKKINRNLGLFRFLGSGAPPELEDVDHPLIKKKHVSTLPWNRVQLLKKHVISSDISERSRDIFLLLIARIFRECANVKFAPGITYTAPKRDFPVFRSFKKYFLEVVNDLIAVEDRKDTESIVIQGDSRFLDRMLIPPRSVSTVITSPPYPVDKEYTRITRLELAILDFVKDIDDVRSIKKQMIRSSSRSVYASDSDVDRVADFESVMRISDEIKKRVEKDGDTSGFAKTYSRTVEEYFGGMHAHLESLRGLLKDDASLHYVVGDSRSFKFVHIKTAEILAEIATSIGYSVVEIKKWRNRNATTHSEELNENMLILRK